VAAVFSPLDERLGLGPSHSSPSLVERGVLLASLLPFRQAQQVLARFSQVVVTAETLRVWSLRLGSAVGALDAACLADLEQHLPDPPAGPALQQLSVDGVMVGLRDGTWAEVRTLALGTLSVPDGRGDSEPLTTDLSYFARLVDAERFGHLATVETHRRGTLSAGRVVGVVDGAPWCQGFLDLQRHDAVRILDFAHAVGYLAAAAEARYPSEPLRAQTWLAAQRQELRSGDATRVIAQLASWLAEDAAAQSGPIGTAHGYLSSRLEQIRYSDFRAAGYPIGSGIVESANKLLVEARLKGRGMHWARTSVNPLLCLRCLLGNGRWEASWPAIWEQVRHEVRRTTAQRRTQRRQRRVLVSAPVPQPPSAPVVQSTGAPPRPKLVVNGKPTTEHPWRKHDFRARVTA
jgi:hypothetical protein